MKKFLFWVVLAIFAVMVGAWFAEPAQAIDIWKTANQITVAWDPVTKLTSGANLPTGNVVKYDVYTKVDGTTTPITKVTATQLTVATYTITFTIEGRFDVGVQAFRYDAANVLLSQSTISWSDVAANCLNGQTFGGIYYESPVGPGGLRSP